MEISIQDMPGMASLRRSSIYFLYKTVYGLCPEDEWRRHCVVEDIMYRLSIPYNSRTSVKTALREMFAQGDDYDTSSGLKSRGRDVLIVAGSVDAEVASKALATGMGFTQATVLLNEHRAGREVPEDPVSWSAVQSFAQASDAISLSKRQKQKSGKDDEGTQWAKAREAQFTQILYRLRLGEHLPIPPWEKLSPLFLEGIVFFDEKHQKQVLGNESKFECRVAVNAEGKMTSPKDGGEFPEHSKQTSMKYAKEARGEFGVGLRRGVDGVLRGARTDVYYYCERTVVGQTMYEKHLKTEKARVVPLRGVWGKEGKGYEDRYGPDRWEAELKKTVDKDYCSVIELMKHCISEGNKIHAGGSFENTWVIFHDALTSWWEPSSQAFLTAEGFKDRQVRCEGDCNAGNRYANKLCGDTPELCRGLDAFGFADLKTSLLHHCAITTLYDLNDPRKFSLSTPATIRSAITRCWSIAPTSDRIMQDILDLPRVCQVIIDAKGCVVQDEFIRHGKRARRADDKGDLKRKITAGQRKSTLTARPLHPDAVDARRKLLAVGDVPADSDDDDDDDDDGD